ncbi:MAG: acetyl-CoA carboxylase biotin carboxyl carrier protein [Mastigocoleus sp.]
MPLDFNEIRQLLATIAQTDIAEVILKNNDFEITVRKASSINSQNLSVGNQTGGLDIATTSELTSAPSQAPHISSNTDSKSDRSTDVASGTTPSQGSSRVIESKWVDVPSPMVGTFYRSPAPGEAHFVEVGDRVRKEQTVCIIEAMKLMNEIETEVSGQVMEILVQNGEPVEYGQPLMRINPD